MDEKEQTEEQTCTCGHHHGSEHHHDHNHEHHAGEAHACRCGHDHDHHDNAHHFHDHHDHDHGVSSLEMSSHEGAVIATVRCLIPGSYEEATDALKAAMKRTAVRIEEQGGLIGHIKSFAREENRSCMISLPEADDLQVKETRAPSVHVECASIVFGLSAEELEDTVKTGFSEWLF